MEKDWMYKIFVLPRYRLHRHVPMIFFIVLVIFNSLPQFIEPVQTIIEIGLVVLLLALSYINMYWFVPRYFFKSRYGTYALMVLIIFAIIYLIYFLSWEILAGYRREDAYKEAAGILSLSFTILVLTMSSTAIKLFQRSLRDNVRINELEKITLWSEMEQLKNQINPHFLFNMLNNVNVLTQKDPVKASQVLMKLSDLLRYQLYDSARARVLLTADIHFVEDFLNLEQIRRDNFEFMVAKEGEINGVQIAPLLLIVFVENAIKHNMDIERKSFVHLYFEVRNNAFHFRCINSKPWMAPVKKEAGGLGLANVRRRLELIYPEKHSLKIEQNTDTYGVYLTISI